MKPRSQHVGAASVSAFPIETVTTIARMVQLEADWRRLAATRPGLFCDYVWSIEWWRSLSAGRALRLQVARSGATVIGIAPFFEERRMGARIWRLIGSAGGGADALDLLCDDAGARTALLAAAAREADVLLLEDLRSDAPLVEAARTISRGRSLIVTRFACPFMSLDGGWASIEARFLRRETLARRERWLAGLSGFRLRRDTDPEEVRRRHAPFWALHAARWADEGGSQAFADARLLAFHRQVAPRLAAEGRLALWSLEVAGRLVAMASTLEDGPRTLYYQSGLDPAWSARSPGLVLLAALVREAAERGQQELDFLRGNESYKYEWATGERRTVSVEWPITDAGERWLARREQLASVRRALTGAVPGLLAATLRRRVRAGRLPVARGTERLIVSPTQGEP